MLFALNSLRVYSVYYCLPGIHDIHCIYVKRVFCFHTCGMYLCFSFTPFYKGSKLQLDVPESFVKVFNLLDSRMVLRGQYRCIVHYLFLGAII